MGQPECRAQLIKAYIFHKNVEGSNSHSICIEREANLNIAQLIQLYIFNQNIKNSNLHWEESTWACSTTSSSVYLHPKCWTFESSPHMHWGWANLSITQLIQVYIFDQNIEGPCLWEGTLPERNSTCSGVYLRPIY